MPSYSSKPVIFLAFANEQEQPSRYLRQLPREVQCLREILNPVRQAGLCEMVERTNATLHDILAVFRDRDYRNRIAIFHFGGHANGYQLLLESGSGTNAADAGGLAAFLSQQAGLHLVFLNGCSTQSQVKELLTTGVPAVIATNQAIADEVAVDFAGAFYRSLVSGVNLHVAFAEAAGEVRAVRGSQTRALYWDEASAEDNWPWALYPETEDDAHHWSLPQATNNALFGLPPLPPGDLPRQPFRHLHWFERRHAELFFGRGPQIRQLYDAVTLPDGEPLILLYGQSGVGKSSLLEAGLLPRLETTCQLRYLRRAQQQGLLGTLQTALGIEISRGQASEVLETLEASDLASAWLTLEAQYQKPLIVILDQVEEIYTRPDPAQPDELEHFLDVLQTIFTQSNCRPQGRLVLGFRKEWLADLEDRLAAHSLGDAYIKIFLTRLERSGVIEAITGPTHTRRLQQKYHLTVEPGLPEQIADDLLADAGSAIAPTLQILLTRLWNQAIQQNPDHPHFSRELYQTLAKEGLLLSDFLDQQLVALRAWRAEVVTSGLALDVLATHTTPLSTAEEQGMEQLLQIYRHRADVLPLLVQQCKDLYLLVDPRENLARQVKASRLAHDALAPLVWERFTNSGFSGQRARRILENRSVEWQDNQVGTPLDEQDLRLVEQGYEGMRSWTEAERRLVEASRAARVKRRQNRKIMMGVFAAAAILILLIAILAIWQWNLSEQAQATVQRQATTVKIESDKRATEVVIRQTAEAEKVSAAVTAEVRRQEALAQQLATQSELLRGRPDFLPQSVLLAAESLRIFPSLTGDQALRKSLDQSPLLFYEFSHYIVRSVAFSPDGRLVAAASTTGAPVWDISSGREIAKLAPDHEVISVAFSSDGQQLTTCMLKVGTAGGSVYCGEVQTWEIHTGRKIAQSSYNVQIATSFALSPDGQMLAIASSNADISDSKVQVWEIRSGREIAKLSHDQFVSSIAFSPDGNWLATGTVDTEKKSAVRIWKVDSGQKVDELLIGQPIHSVTFSPNGQWLAINRTGDALDIWEIGSRRNVVQLLHGVDPLIESVAFSPDSQWLATLSYKNSGTVSEMRVWEVNTGQDVSLLPIDDKIATYVAFSPDGRRIAIGSTTGVSIWEFNPYQAIVRLPSGNQFVLSLAFSPDSQSLAIGGAKAKGEIGKPQIWDISSGREVSHLPQDRQVGTSVAFNSDGSWLAVGGVNKTLVWDLKAGKEVVKLPHPEQGVLSVAFSQDSRWLVTGSNKKDGSSGEVRVWEISSGRETVRLPHKDQVVTSVALSLDGHWLATVSNKNDNITSVVRIWEISSGREVMQLPHNNQAVWSVAFSPDGQFLATGGTGKARIWEINSGKEIVQLLHNDQVVWSVAFSPDGKWLATGASDAKKSSSEVRVWEISSHRIVAQIPHGKFLTTVAFSPDGHWLATGSSNSDGTFGETRVWLWRPEDLIMAACQRLKQNLSWTEWQQYLGQEPYHKTCPDLPGDEDVPPDAPRAP